MVSNGTRL